MRAHAHNRPMVAQTSYMYIQMKCMLHPLVSLSMYLRTKKLSHVHILITKYESLPTHNLICALINVAFNAILSG